MTGATADARRFVADARAQIDEVHRMGAQVRAEQEAFRAAARDSDERRERAARSGAMGPDWQRLQVRIDAGQTTFARAMSGADDSPEAVALRTRVEVRATGARAQLEEELAEARTPDPVFAENRRLMDELRGTMARLEEINRALGRG